MASWKAHARNLREKSTHLGMEHPGAAGRGEVDTCRGGEAILNELGPKQPAYVLNWVGRVTQCTLARVTDG